MTTRRSQMPPVVLGPGGRYRRQISGPALSHPHVQDLLCLALAFLMGVLVGVII